MGRSKLKQVVYPDQTLNSNIQPVSKGGTGAITRSEALSNLGAIDIALLGTPLGVAKADANGNVPGSYLPTGSVDQDTVSLDGPTSVLVDSDSVFTVTDYDYNKSYAISVVNGTMYRQNDKLFIKAPSTTGVLKIMINNVEHLIDIVEPEIIVAIPSITSPVDGVTNISVTPVLSASPFTLESGTDTHASTDWEIRTEASELGETVWSSYNNTANKTTINVTGLDNLVTYHARCRYKSTSGKVTDWSPFSRFTTTALQTIGASTWTGTASSADGLRLCVAKYDGYIYTSTDGGVTWLERTASGARKWVALASSSNGLRLVGITYNGNIHTSADGGVTWVERTGSGSRNWYDVAMSADGMTIVAVVWDGYIYVSADGGATWEVRILGSTRQWHSVACSADGQRMVAGDCGSYIFVSTNGGVTWAAKTSVGAMYRLLWRRIAMSADGLRIYAIATNNHIYVSTDGGDPDTWAVKVVGTARQWQDIACSSDGQRVVAVVKDGYIYTSTDGGNTWVERVGAGSTYWYDVDSSDDGMRMIAVVNGGYVCTSSDGGVNWTSR